MMEDPVRLQGVFTFEINGKLLTARNTVVTVGRNILLSALFAGTAGTPQYFGLITATGYTAIAAGDTMLSHTGWAEVAVGVLTGGVRQAPTWAAAAGGAINLTTPVSFTITGSDTIQGSFIVLGGGTTSAIGNTGGTLFAAGSFGVGQPVISGNTLTVSYSLTTT